jgi:hypothetical protein
MNTHQTAVQIARRLPAWHRRGVQEVLDVLTELWRDELAQPDGEIHITDLGTLYVETHAMRVTGVVRESLQQKYGSAAPETLPRRVIRFRPYEALRDAIQQQADKPSDNNEETRDE